MDPIIVLGLILTAIIIAVIIIIVVMNKYQGGHLNEFPSDMQFSEREYRSGDGFTDRKHKKFGKIKILRAKKEQDFISWNEFFQPSLSQSKNKRKKAIGFIGLFYLILFLLIVIFSFLDLIWGILLMLVLAIYLTCLIFLKFIQIRVMNRPDKL